MSNWLQIFLDWQYWFKIPLPIKKINLIILLCVAGGCILLSIIFLFFKRIKKKDFILPKVLKKFYVLFLALGIVGFIIIFFRYESVPVLGLRFWYLVWLVSAIVWLIFILIYALRKLPQERRELEDKKIFEKYLP